MKQFEYIPSGVCARKMVFEIDNDIIKDIVVIGGCPGNSLGVVSLCKNKKVDEVINKLEKIKCGSKNTSCPDQIAKALMAFKKEG